MTTMRALAFSLAALLFGSLAGCGGGVFSSPRRRVAPPPVGTTPTAPVATPGPVATTDPNAPGAAGSPLDRLNAVDAHLSQRGFTRVGPAVRNANMTAGGLVAYAIEGLPGQCFVAVALASPSSDLNMIVIDPRGQDIGHDVMPDASPHVRVCPTQSGRHIARVQMARGGGEHYYALYRGAPSADPQLAAFFGTTSPAATAAPQVADRNADIDARLAAYDRQLATQRYQRVGEARGLVLRRGEDRQFTINLQQAYCYTFASVAGDGARDSDLSILNGAGETIERDVRSDRDALVEYCPPSSGSFVLKALLHAGDGPVFLASWTRPRTGQTATPPPDEGVVISSQSTAGGGVAEAFALRDADIRARGYETYGERTSGRLAPGQSAEQTIRLEGGKCYALVATGDNGVRDLDLTVVDSRGREVDRHAGASASATVRVCAPSTGEYRAQVRMADGGGDYLVQAYRWPRGTRGPFGLSGLIYVRLAEVTSLLSLEGYEPDANFSPGQGTIRREGGNASHTLELPGGRCYAVLVVGGDGVVDLDLRLRQGTQELGGDTSVNAFPDVRTCAAGPTRLTLEVQAHAGQGDYFYQVFSRDG